MRKMRRCMFRMFARAALGVALAALVFLWATVARAQSANDGFTPAIGVGAEPYPGVYAVAVQNDGKILIGGDFVSVGGQTRNRLARLNVDGSLDSAFAATDVDGPVSRIAVMPDHRIVIAGTFDQVGVYARHRIARLNADGSVDAAFDAHLQDVLVSGTPSGSVRALALQADGKLIVGGVFSGIGGSNRSYLARLRADGSADAAFNPTLDAFARTIAIQPDGKIVVSGAFAQVNGQPHSVLVRLLPSGATDAGFAASIDTTPYGAVYALALQPDGKMLVGGLFTSVNGQARNCLVRLQANGSLDAGYAPPINFDPVNNGDYVSGLTLMADGRLIVTGQLYAFNNGYGNQNITRLLRDGSLDASLAPGLGFDAGANPYVSAVAIEPSGNILVGGPFTATRVAAGHAIFELNQPYLARLDAHEMAPLTGNTSGTDGSVYALALQTDGKLLVGGDFSHILDWGVAGSSNPNVPRSRLARLNPDQSLDPFFIADVTGGVVTTIAVQPGGKILVGGTFTTIGGLNRNRLARLNADGSVDPDFDPNVDSVVYALALQADGSILVGGGFQNIGNFSTGNYHIPYIARLHADGSVDPSYYPSADSYVYNIALQADGSALIGGNFTTIQTLTRNNIARILASGSIDTTFDPGIGSNGEITGMALQPDGKVIVGGFFGSFAHNNALRGLARLNSNGTVDTSFAPDRPVAVNGIVLQGDGKLIVNGEFYATSVLSAATLLRLNVDGNSDPTYAPSCDALVYAIALQPDGQLFAGGAPFSTIGGQSRANLARLNTPQAALQSLNAAGSTVTWARSGSAAELGSAPILEFSVAGSLFVPLGTMHHVIGGWKYDGFVAPAGQSFFLRARAPLPSGNSNGSYGLVESTRWFAPLSDVIFANGFE
jgi:uncharacterized delta-60 repeat protein